METKYSQTFTHEPASSVPGI